MKSFALMAQILSGIDVVLLTDVSVLSRHSAVLLCCLTRIVKLMVPKLFFNYTLNICRYTETTARNYDSIYLRWDPDLSGFKKHPGDFDKCENVRVTASQCMTCCGPHPTVFIHFPIHSYGNTSLWDKHLYPHFVKIRVMSQKSEWAEQGLDWHAGLLAQSQLCFWSQNCCLFYPNKMRTQAKIDKE